jgi:hypothetical protein
MYYTVQRDPEKHGMKIQCIDNNPSEKKWHSAVEFLSVSVLPEDDPVGSKH